MGDTQLVARRLWCTDHQLGCLVWWLNPACSHARYTPNHYWASTVRDSWLDVPWGIGCMFVSLNPHPASVTWNRNRHVLKFQPRRAKHHAKYHAKRVGRCRSPWLKSRWFQTVSNCSCWQTSIVLFEYENVCEWHPSNQTLQCSVVTIRCYPWSAGSWQVFHIVGLCVCSHQSANYSIAVAHLTSNSFEGHPCCMHADYLPSLFFWYSPSYHAYWEWIFFFKTPDLNTQIRSVIFLIMRERQGSRAWLVDIRHNGHTCVSTSF
jgi:hypothetical protein